MPLEKREFEITAHHANDFQGTVLLAALDDVTANVRRTNAFAKIAAVVPNVRVLCSQPTLLTNFRYPLPCGNGLIFGDKASDLFQSSFDASEYRSLGIILALLI